MVSIGVVELIRCFETVVLNASGAVVGLDEVVCSYACLSGREHFEVGSWFAGLFCPGEDNLF